MCLHLVLNRVFHEMKVKIVSKTSENCSQDAKISTTYLRPVRQKFWKIRMRITLPRMFSFKDYFSRKKNARKTRKHIFFIKNTSQNVLFSLMNGFSNWKKLFIREYQNSQFLLLIDIHVFELFDGSPQCLIKALYWQKNSLRAW